MKERRPATRSSVRKRQTKTKENTPSRRKYTSFYEAVHPKRTRFHRRRKDPPLQHLFISVRLFQHFVLTRGGKGQTDIVLCLPFTSQTHQLFPL